MCVSDAERGNPGNPLTTMGHITDEFRKHRIWFVDLFTLDGVSGDRPGLFAAMQLMTAQFAHNSMQRMQILGSFFDAKHQLESQRLFQSMTAETNRRYYVSQNFCALGSMTTSLARTSREMEFSSQALATRAVNRQLAMGENIGVTTVESDQFSKLYNFITKYCDPRDNKNNLDYLCARGAASPENFNRDISFDEIMTRRMTLELDFTDNAAVSADEDALFSLNDYLFSHELFPTIEEEDLLDDDGNPDYDDGAKDLMNARALVAKTSVGVNSLAAIAALKTQGDDAAEPFIYGLIYEMGGDQQTVEHIQSLIGENPSYYAQMKILSKIFYQRPEFFVELYDTPENVMRMNTALQAITLMRKRDIYRSYLRTEATLATMLEAALVPEIRLISNEIRRNVEQSD
ncbi:MAG: hypothetical protein AAF549_02745 [Pseudomonadota bacterium]